ncbi:MAG: rhamnogalacturonan acetylesterase [Butyrivibrio sp.]|nr:rhamnogalacturonan acetylesterase [Butyrivibrio sp.]
MTVNVCDIVPRGHTEVYEDKTLDITLLGSRPAIGALTVEEADCPTVFIAGDSTVTDQSGEYPYAPGTSYSGWGQMLSAYLTDGLAVSNHAHSGLTTHTFRQEGHYGIVEKYIRPGDYYFCQFGHNDQKLAELKAEGGYRANLLRYIQECRERGAFPVLLTPIARNTWKGNDGTYNDLLEEYADTCVRLGEQEDVPVLDLHGRSMDFIVKNGLEASKAYFFPGDYTHSNDYGAYYMAGLVAEEIVRVCGSRREPAYRFLAECVRPEGFGAWPPAERILPLTRPAVTGSAGGENDKDNGAGGNGGEAQFLSEIGDLTEPADRVSALDMVIKTVRFFPTNVYNDMFGDVVGHEWFAGTVECAYQNGMIDPGLVEEGNFFPLRPVTLEEFLVFAVNGYKSRKTIPAEYMETPCIYDERCREYARPYVRAACRLGLIAEDGSIAPDRVITRGQAVEICRKMGV